MSNLPNIDPKTVSETVELIKMAQRAAMPDDLLKAFSQPSSATSGLQMYDLQAPSLKLYPVLTPLRNMIPRVADGFGTQANWRAVTGINTSNQRAGVSEGHRGAVIAQSTVEYFAAYRAYGLENYVTWDADFSSKGFEDLKALAVLNLLQALMIQEERLDLAGNTSVALGTTPTPPVVAGTSGSMPTQSAASVICVALGPQAYLDVAGHNMGVTGQVFDPTTATVPGQITKNNADGSSDTFGGGAAQKGAAATVSVTGPNGSISATVAPVKGAWGYAWFVGPSAGNERLAAVTTVNSVVLTSFPSSGQLASSLPASDCSTSSLDYDGLFAQAIKTNAAYYASLPTGTVGTGTGLTADGAGGIADFEAAFAAFYSRYRLSPTHIFVSAQELVNITKKIIGNSGAPLLRLTMDADQVAQGMTAGITAGARVGSYLNKVTGQVVQMVVHPLLPPGTILFFSESVPYPMPNTPYVVRKRLRRDYYQIEWPLKTRCYEYGVYADGVLQHFAPFSMGVITNIGNV